MNFENTIFNTSANEFVNEYINTISEAPVLDEFDTEFCSFEVDEDALIADEFFQ